MYIFKTQEFESPFQWHSIFQCIVDNGKKYLVNCIGYNNFYETSVKDITYNITLQIPLVQYVVEENCVVVSSPELHESILNSLHNNKKVYVVNDVYIINNEESYVVEDSLEETLINQKIKKLQFISILMKSRLYNPVFRTFNSDLFVLQKLILDNKIKVQYDIKNNSISKSLKTLYEEYNNVDMYNSFISMLDDLNKTELFYMYTITDVDVSVLTKEEQDIVNRFLFSSHYFIECLSDYYKQFIEIHEADTIEKLNISEQKFLRLYYSTWLAQI